MTGGYRAKRLMGTEESPGLDRKKGGGTFSEKGGEKGDESAILGQPCTFSNL